MKFFPMSLCSLSIAAGRSAQQGAVTGEGRVFMLYLITALLCTFPGSHWQLPQNSDRQIFASPRSLLAVSVAEPVNSIADDRNAPDRRRQSIFCMLLNADEFVQDSAAQTNGNAVG